MMKRLAIVAALMQIPALVALGENKEGSCQLKQCGAFDKDVVTVHVGEKIQGTCRFHITDFFKRKIINAGVEIVNTSDRRMHCQYYVAFFDEQGTLIGCAAQGTFGAEGLAAGKSTQLASVLFPCPPAFLKRRSNTRSPSTNPTRRLEKPPPRSVRRTHLAGSGRTRRGPTPCKPSCWSQPVEPSAWRREMAR